MVETVNVNVDDSNEGEMVIAHVRPGLRRAEDSRLTTPIFCNRLTTSLEKVNRLYLRSFARTSFLTALVSVCSEPSSGWHGVCLF